MLINQKTMMSPMASWPLLFNRIKANMGVRKALPEELWSLQTVSDSSCQDRCSVTDFIDFPKGRSIISLCGFLGKVG